MQTPYLNSKSIHEECGVFGIWDPSEDAARVTFFALFSLQHRGQESAGIASSNGRDIKIYKSRGLVSQVFSEEELSKLEGHLAVGHNRYSTTGSDRDTNASPMLINSDLGTFAIAHNGNITNAMDLKEMLPSGTTLVSTTDSEILGEFIAAQPGKTFEDKILCAMKVVEGAYSIVLMTNDALYGFRDPLGFRPLTIARINGDGFAFSSETCAFGTVGAKRIRDLEPGEIIKVDKDGYKSFQYPTKKQAFCIFEYVYFLRPDSVVAKKSVYGIRERLGRSLAPSMPKNADMVIGMPDSGIPAAIGLALESGVPFREGLVKSKYIGRTFINPDQIERLKAITLKLNALRSVITDKVIVLVDDSIVRGNTTKKVVKLLKDKGAKEVHVRISCPPIKHPCFFGVDFPSPQELIGSKLDVEQIRESIGADSLVFVSIDDMVKATELPKEGFCMACFNGDYPVKIKLGHDAKSTLEEAR